MRLLGLNELLVKCLGNSMTQSKLYINIVKYNFKRTKNDYQNSKILLIW